MRQLFICLIYTKINTVKLLRNLVHSQSLKSLTYHQWYLLHVGNSMFFIQSTNNLLNSYYMQGPFLEG